MRGSERAGPKVDERLGHAPRDTLVPCSRTIDIEIGFSPASRNKTEDEADHSINLLVVSGHRANRIGRLDYFVTGKALNRPSRFQPPSVGGKIRQLSIEVPRRVLMLPMARSGVSYFSYMTPTTPKLSPRRAAFAREYVLSGNAAEAATVAG